MKRKRLRIGLDVDDTLVDFMGSYIKTFGAYKSDSEITRNVYKLKNNKLFWESLPKINDIDFEPELYCTKRINSKVYTRNSLKKHNFPIKPIYQVYYQKANKANFIKGKVDVFIDDSISNFEKMNDSGILCLLITAPHNKGYETKLRIDNLKYETILEMYNLYGG